MRTPFGNSWASIWISSRSKSVKRWSSASSAKWSLLERRWISTTCSLLERLLRAAQVQRRSLKGHQVNFTACVWQSELIFKSWKTYANLHAFDTENPAIVEG